MEDGNTATHAIAQGQYVIWKGVLYTADAAIASGTTLAASGGTKNLTAVSGGGLNALNSITTESSTVELRLGTETGTVVATGTATHKYCGHHHWVNIIFLDCNDVDVNNVAYIRVNFRQANMNNITITYTKSAAICEDLLSIGNYTDEQEIIDGTVTRKVGVLVLDGTEAWSTTSGTFTLKSNDLFQTATFPCLCTHYKGATPQETAASQANKTMKAGYRANPDNDRKFYLKDQSFANTDELKTFLANQYAAGTPVIVVYPLKDTTTETVTPQPMQTGQGDNTAEITQASLDGLELQVTYMAGVQLTVEEVEDEQLSPNVEVTIQ